MKGVQEGDILDLDSAVKEYGGRLLRYAASILMSHADAEDAVQDAFLAAFRHQERFDGTNASAWLFKITYNMCMSKRRKRGLLFFADIQQEPSAPAGNEHPKMPEIMKALAPMKPADRALIYMRIVEGYNYDELAIIMGKRPAALRKAFMRARNRAATLLESYREG